jgi:hypothetical protein
LAPLEALQAYKRQLTFREPQSAQLASPNLRAFGPPPRKVFVQELPPSFYVMFLKVSYFLEFDACKNICTLARWLQLLKMNSLLQVEGQESR